ncbi:hypothetical protein MKY98_08490 [Paenibacillus sp. FSL M8-0228]|nr:MULTISPECIES: hypothetical protein [Paenibacillus]MBO3283972.1 hypothetical protein [Paenibacillus polymyxa]MBP1310975.1 putative membrane protein [Paenibacillus sp. 1182]
MELFMNIAGLILNMLGTVIMAIDVLCVDPQAGTYADLTDGKKKAYKSRKFAIVGLLFIFLGFLLQFFVEVSK